jgi:hypothetical protein
MDIGKWFEKKTKEALDVIQSLNMAMQYRFPDSNSARNYLQAQPGDHMLLINGTAILIEEKCSNRYSTLRSGFSGMWSKKQASYHRLWNRSGCPSWVVFCDHQREWVEIWRGDLLAGLRVKGKKIPANYYPMAEGSIKSLVPLIKQAVDLTGETK